MMLRNIGCNEKAGRPKSEKPMDPLRIPTKSAGVFRAKAADFPSESVAGLRRNQWPTSAGLRRSAERVTAYRARKRP